VNFCPRNTSPKQAANNTCYNDSSNIIDIIKLPPLIRTISKHLNTRGKEKVKVYNRNVWQGSSLSNNLLCAECISTEGEKVSACRFTQHNYPCSQPTLFLSRFRWNKYANKYIVINF